LAILSTKSSPGQNDEAACGGDEGDDCGDFPDGIRGGGEGPIAFVVFGIEALLFGVIEFCFSDCLIPEARMQYIPAQNEPTEADKR
jgi:hypothetical protein